jgi:hypothetical protein
MTKEMITNLAKALSAVQAEMKSVKKSADNPFFKSKYADLAAVCDYAYPILAKHGLAISQPAVLLNDKLYVQTVLMHASGDYMKSYWPITGVKQQELGSSTSYARRYSLMAIIGLSASGEDDDGNAEAKAPPPPVNKNKMILDVQELVKKYNIDPVSIVNFNLETFKKAKVNELDVNQLEQLTKWLVAKGVSNERFE